MAEPTILDDERARVGSPSLPGAIVSAWLTAAVAMAATFTTFQRWFPGHGAIALATAMLVSGVLSGARAASQREGAWGVLIASLAFAGTLPAFIALSLFGATRPLMACRGVVGVDCFPTHATFIYFGAATTIVPLALSSVVAVVVARRRGASLARVLVGLAVAGWFVAMIVAGGGALRASRQVSADRYLDTLTELGRLDGARFAASPFSPDADPDFIEGVRLSGSSRVAGRWSCHPNRFLPCNLAIGGGSYDVAAVERGYQEIVCPPVRVREDPQRHLLVVDEIKPDGSFYTAFAVSPDHTSGPLYVMHGDLENVAPARSWVIVALAGVLGSLALVLVRLFTERRLLARWRAELTGATPGRDYRSLDRAADQVTDGVLARVVQDGSERRAATFVLAGLVAVIAATPLAAALFVIGR